MVFAGATSGMYGGDRVRPVPGAPSAAAAASVGLPSEGRERSCRPVTARPRVNLSRLRPVPSRLFSLRLCAPPCQRTALREPVRWQAWPT